MKSFIRRPRFQATRLSHPMARALVAVGMCAGVASTLLVACSGAPGDGSSQSGSDAIIVGGSRGGSDFAAQIDAGIVAAVGSFPSVTGVTGESDSYTNTANGFSLQLNTNRFPTSLCSADAGATSPNCVGWQQFVYAPWPTTEADGGTTETGNVYIEYWLINYSNNDAGAYTCPPGWKKQALPGQADCDLDSPPTTVAVQPITNLANLQLSASAGAQDTLTMTINGVAHPIIPQKSVLGLNNAWTTAEFNVFGNSSGSNASINSNATITVKTLVTAATPTTAAPGCTEFSNTAETNSLTLNTTSCTAFGGAAPGIQFNETSVLGGACGTNSVLGTNGSCVVVGSTCVNTSGPPNTYIWDSAGTCVAVGSGCGTAIGYIIDSTGQCVGVGSGCGANEVLSNLGYCVVIGSGCAINGDAPGVWSSTGQCWEQSITCPVGEAPAGPPGGQYCASTTPPDAGPTHGSGGSGGTGGGTGSGGGCKTCPKPQ